MFSNINYGIQVFNVRALAAFSLVQMNAWHSKTRTPCVRRRMAAKMGGWQVSGKLANGESKGKNFSPPPSSA
uniref:Uncharacterized protein n=1 Tax=Romanomermis culicivorax TaxID=13658 RepID=A0A915L706_ROMCU